MIEIRQVDPLSAEVQILIQQLDKYQLALYPAESNHLDPVTELASNHVYFTGAYRHGELVGIGAIKYMDEFGESCNTRYGEIKRVYVSEQARGAGVSRKIMADLETDALQRGVVILRLETGTRQPEALALYRKLGYRERTAFGDYPTDDPLSVFMEKVLQ